jgi:hypothetical protein
MKNNRTPEPARKPTASEPVPTTPFEEKRAPSASSHLHPQQPTSQKLSPHCAVQCSTPANTNR